MFTSKTDEWPTPQWLFDEWNTREGPCTVDVAATGENAKCPHFFTWEDDGLTQTWLGRVWLNPPYGRQLAAWVAKAWVSAQTSAELVTCLLPARTDTSWWHEYATRGEVHFLRGRVRFGDADAGAPFPSAVVVFRNASAAVADELTAAAEDGALGVSSGATAGRLSSAAGWACAGSRG